MKKWVALMMICLLVVGCVGFSNGYCLAATRPEPDSLQYTLTKRVEASLEISSTGKATCRGYIRASSTDSTIDIMHNEESIHFYTGIVVNWRNGAC